MPTHVDILWDDEPGGNVEHLADHDVTVDEVEAVLRSAFDARERSRGSPDRWVVSGFTPSARFLVVVFEYLPDSTW